MKAGARIAEHRADETASIHTLSGHVRVQLPEKVVALTTGRLLILERALRHDIEAVAESAFLLTLGWKEKSSSEGLRLAARSRPSADAAPESRPRS